MRNLFLACLTVFSIQRTCWAAPGHPTGVWVNDEQGWIVETRPCGGGGALCGYLVGFRVEHPHPPGYVSRDVLNPDPTRRAAPLCGLPLIGGFTPSKRADGEWSGGWIYNPDTGRTYSGIISTVDADTVRLRAYEGIPLLGRTIVLHRESGDVERCSAPAGNG